MNHPQSQPNSASLTSADRAKKKAAYHQLAVEKLATAIRAVVASDDLRGALFAYGEEALLLSLAIEVGFGPGARSTEKRRQAAAQFSRNIRDLRTGRKKLEQGDKQATLRAAVQYAIDHELIAKHIDSDGMIALYLPAPRPPKWRVHLATGRVINDYEPTDDELLDFFGMELEPGEEEYLPRDHERAMLAIWGAQFAN